MADPVTAAVAVGWGMKAAGWIVSPIISQLVKRGSAYLGFDASKKLKELETKLLLLERVMEAVEESPYRPRLERLFRNLKSAFYEAEDILDDVDYHLLERQIQESKVKSDDRVKKRIKSVISSSTLKNQESGQSKIQLKKSFEKIEKVIDDACKILDQLNLPSIANCNGRQVFPTNSCSPVTTAAPPLKVFGRDNERDKIIAILHDIEYNGQQNTKFLFYFQHAAQRGAELFYFLFSRLFSLLFFFFPHHSPPLAPPALMENAACSGGCIPPSPPLGSATDTNSDLWYSVLGIHGIAGSGKSTLAQFVYARVKEDKQENKAGHFDLVMWVHVSQKFDLDAILRELVEGATDNPCPQFTSRNKLEEYLEQKLQGKRIFLVLDDVWYNSRDVRHPNKLRETLSRLRLGGTGSKILVTSRSKDALLALGAVEERCIPISDLDDEAFFEMFMHYALQDARIDGHDRAELKEIGSDIAKKLKRSPLAAKTVGAQLRLRPNCEFWRRTRDRDLLNDTMGALWWSYQHLDEQVRRCFAYCSIYPRRNLFTRKELVQLWMAEGFIQTTNAEEELDGIGQNYFDELLSASFLQPGRWVGYFTVHDLLRDLAEEAARGDCFRIEEGFTGEVPLDVRHLAFRSCDRKMLAEKILELKNLRTLIFDCYIPIDDETFQRIFMRLQKLRVLILRFSANDGGDTFSVPACIGQLKHLRYLKFDVPFNISRLNLPDSVTKLYHIQVLDVSGFKYVVFFGSKNMHQLGNLRYLSRNLVCIPNIGRLKRLQMLQLFYRRKEQGYELRELKNLNKLEGQLRLLNLENVESKGEAVEASLADNERLTELQLVWKSTSCHPEVEAEVLEGLCPPKSLLVLDILNYNGSTYPNWMVGKQNGGPTNLQCLYLIHCTRLEPAPELFEVFVHLRRFQLWDSNWHALPDNMELLTSLQELSIRHCFNIRSLPALPRSLEEFGLLSCDEEFMRSCQTINDPNWQKIQHIPKKWIENTYSRLPPKSQFEMLLHAC